jgi:hypothetical protein
VARYHYRLGRIFLLGIGFLTSNLMISISYCPVNDRMEGAGVHWVFKKSHAVLALPNISLMPAPGAPWRFA